MFRNLVIAIFGLIVILTAILALALFRDKPSITVSVKSEPEGATVFSDRETLGVTPVPVKMREGETLKLRLVRRDYHDAEIELNSKKYNFPSSLAHRLGLKPVVTLFQETVQLESTAESRLQVSVLPSETEIFVDGHRIGVSPLPAFDIAPGSHTIRLVHPECFPQTENVTLSPGESLVLERKLSNKIVAFYREQMRKEPHILVHTAELAHHHILRGEYDDAAQAFRDGFEGIGKADGYQQTKFWEEMSRFATNYYARPSGDDQALRQACMELINRAIDKKIGNAQQLQNYLKQLQK